MPVETIARTWTLASWMVSGVDADDVSEALRGVGADAIALQWIRREAVERVADDLRMRHAWEFSYHPVTRLLPGSAVGLAILTPHSIGDSASVVTNNHSSKWSRRRRIAHFAVVDRSDHSGYTIGHAVDTPDPEKMGGRPPAPMVWFRPASVDADPSRAVDLPAEASVVSSAVSTPVDGQNSLLTVTFEMPWVAKVRAAD